MNDLLQYVDDAIGFLAVFGIAIEASPIKINPIQWIGNKLNKSVNDRIDKIQQQVDEIEYKNAMKDLADVRNRLISYGLILKNGEQLNEGALRSIQHDLDVYDYYKDTYVYMTINGRKVKINGEIELTRKLLIEAFHKFERDEKDE